MQKVEVRVGVDITNDGKIDGWTNWQEVKEQYDYIEGFSKQIERTPAAIDLSGLPEGYGFSFEMRITNSSEKNVMPIMDNVSLFF